MAFDPYAAPSDNSGWGTAPGQPPAFAQYPPPPGQYPAPYGYGPAGIGSPTPLAGLGTAVSVALGVVGLLEVLRLIARLNQTSVLEQIKSDPGSVSLAAATRSDHFVALATGIWLLAWIPTVVLFLVWLYRARKNVEFFGPRFQRHSPGWAIGSWFIPFASLVLPYRVVADVQLDSRPNRPEQRSATPLTLTWWLCWVVANVIVVFTVGRAPTTVDGLIGRNEVYLASHVVMVVAAVLAILVVRSITGDQTTRIQAPAPASAYPQY